MQTTAPNRMTCASYSGITNQMIQPEKWIGNMYTVIGIFIGYGLSWPKILGSIIWRCDVLIMKGYCFCIRQGLPILEICEYYTKLFDVSGE